MSLPPPLYNQAPCSNSTRCVSCGRIGADKLQRRSSTYPGIDTSRSNFLAQTYCCTNIDSSYQVWANIISPNDFLATPIKWTVVVRSIVWISRQCMDKGCLSEPRYIRPQEGFEVCSIPLFGIISKYGQPTVLQSLYLSRRTRIAYITKRLHRDWCASL